jgi:hypothetical protein
VSTAQQVVDCVGEWVKAHGIPEGATETTAATAAWTSATPLPVAAASGAAAAPNAGTFLVKRALLHASEDAFGRHTHAHPHTNLSLILQAPQQLKRRIHDDTSVIVVFFKPAASTSSSAAAVSSVEAERKCAQQRRRPPSMVANEARGANNGVEPPSRSKL